MLSIKTPEQHHFRQSSVFIVNFVCFTSFSSVFVVDFEQVSVSWYDC